MDEDDKKRKKEAREVHTNSRKAQKLRGLKAKLFNKKRYKEKAIMKKTIKAHEEKDAEVKVSNENKAAVPTFLLDREETNRSKILSNTIKQKRKEKAGKWQVPIPKVNNLFKFKFRSNPCLKQKCLQL
jgi:ribosome biogenesis protein NSA2